MSWSPSLRVYDVASQSPNHMSSHVFEKVLGSYLERLPYFSCHTENNVVPASPAIYNPRNLGLNI